MSTINPSGLYSQSEGIFNARPYAWHEQQLQAHQDAKDDALNEYYKNLPNTINDKGLRDIDVPGVNEARNAISQNFILNKKQILKGNTPESFNYQKQVRDLQGKIQEGLNASQISNKIGALKTDPNKSYMFQSDDKMKQIVDHNLSVFDKDRQGINLTNFTADPKPFNLNDYQKVFKDIKPDMVKTYEPIKGTNLTVTEVQTPKFTDGDLNNIHKRATNQIYTDPTFIPHIKGWLAKNPDQLPVLDQTFKKNFGHPMTEGSEGDIATAYTLMGMDMTSKSGPIPNVQGAYDQKLADKRIDASTRQSYKQQNIAQNASQNVPINNVYKNIDEIATNAKNKGQAYAQVNLVDTDGQSALINQAKGLSPNKSQNQGTIKIKKEDNGKVGMYGAEDNNFIGYVNQTGINLKQQADVKAKKLVVAQGNAKAIVPIKKKGKYD